MHELLLLLSCPLVSCMVGNCLLYLHTFVLWTSHVFQLSHTSSATLVVLNADSVLCIKQDQAIRLNFFLVFTLSFFVLHHISQMRQFE